jgi:hypothetical protein
MTEISFIAPPLIVLTLADTMHSTPLCVTHARTLKSVITTSPSSCACRVARASRAHVPDEADAAND